MTTDSLARAGRTTDRALRLGLLAVAVAGIRRRDPSAIVNALVGLAATFLPRVIERRAGLSLRPAHRVWISGSVLLHAVGMLGPYDETWWWDHLTHICSASLVGAAAHLFADHRERNTTRTVLVATVGLGALWELLEYAIHATARRLGLEPLLVTYGPRDTALDLVFDAIGGLGIVAFGDRILDGIRDERR
ncbi:hypotheical protein [Halarchaeum acidiphilum MH1-52-1]|uniref:Hypotheical protein n=1 Tax=Halarchaeum acidiphilum MH1-52-1 TaxID=1261545 RepID=U2YWC3_9EURY|nr:hypothetical protein [Halarchaeum acidiphilum]GAD53102.1 hypotheical protein [Halarchaeum acidiphilum MH1-52-1]